MDNEEFSILSLSLCRGIGPGTVFELIDAFKSAQNALLADCECLVSTKGIGEKRAHDILSEIKNSEGIAQKVIKRCNELSIKIMTYKTKGFPKRLSKSYLPFLAPCVIYIRGDAQILEMPSVGIVGARRCERAAKECAAEIAREAVEDKKAVISGMAKGVDSYAHTEALLKNGKTAAILGCGADICYPAEHELLMKRIIENGVLVSEYPPGKRPAKYSFPARNRLIAALSDIIYVIGAKRGSGALTTAQFAEKQGKIVIRDQRSY